MVDLLLDNKSPSPWEQGGKTSSWKGTIYVNVRLIDITMGKKRSVNPMVCKWLLVKVKCEELVSKFCINEFGAIINVEVSRTTGVCWGLYSVGYCSLNVIHTCPLQVGHDPDLAIAGWTNSDFAYHERERLFPDWALVLMETSHATYRPPLISLCCSLRESHNPVCLTNSKQHPSEVAIWLISGIQVVFST